MRYRDGKEVRKRDVVQCWLGGKLCYVAKVVKIDREVVVERVTDGIANWSGWKPENLVLEKRGPR